MQLPGIRRAGIYAGYEVGAVLAGAHPEPLADDPPIPVVDCPPVVGYAAVDPVLKLPPAATCAPVDEFEVPLPPTLPTEYPELPQVHSP